MTQLLIHGAVAGWLSAAAVDYRAFLAWQSIREFATYNWETAIWRWVQGAIAGAVTAIGFSSFDW
ncbi:MAG: hypothetical protein WC655_17195 [Candidatus Hydrogenedentales bacterium]|jgi:hypothetical protein